MSFKKTRGPGNEDGSSVIFVWSSSSAVNGSPARTYDDNDVAQHGAHTGHLKHCIHLCNLILEIHAMVN